MMSSLIAVFVLVCLNIVPLSTATTTFPPQRFMSFYGVNVTAQKGWLNLGVASSLEDIYDLSNASIPSLYRMPESGIYDHSNHSLLPSWNATVTAFASESVLPLMKAGIVKGVFLGDEICCDAPVCLNATLAPILATLRSVLGSSAVLYENDCSSTFKGLAPGAMIPADLDLIGFDLYTGYGPTGGGEKEAGLVEALAKAALYPALHPGQRFMAVPGTFACSSSVPLNVSSASVVAKLEAYFEWTLRDDRIAGWNPWHINKRGSPQHGPPCDMRLGAADMPDVLAKLAQVGRNFSASVL